AAVPCAREAAQRPSLSGWRLADARGERAMTFQTNPDRDCAQAWEAMPWVLQGSAPPEQGESLMSHLVHCESCRAEFARQSRLQLALSLPSDIPLDANVGLKHLLGRLDAPVPQETPIRPRAAGWATRALVAAVLVQAL